MRVSRGKQFFSQISSIKQLNCFNEAVVAKWPIKPLEKFQMLYWGVYIIFENPFMDSILSLGVGQRYLGMPQSGSPLRCSLKSSHWSKHGGVSKNISSVR